MTADQPRDAAIAALTPQDRFDAATSDPASLDAWLIEQWPLLRDEYVAYVVARVESERALSTATPEPPGHVHDGEWCKPCVTHGADKALRFVSDTQAALATAIPEPPKWEPAHPFDPACPWCVAVASDD